MPPSPALRCSPGRELRADSHKRGRSLESGLPFREKDDDLTLFNEMQSRETENFLLQSSDNLEDPFSTKLRHFSDIKLGISIPGRGESSELLNADGDKNDYDWLLTPPDTPLFPSLDDDEPPPINVAIRGRPQSKPISISRSSTMEKSHRSSRGSASPNRLSPSPRSGNNMPQTRGRPSSVPNSSPTQSLRHATPTRRPSTPPNKSLTPMPRSSTPTPRRMSSGSNDPVVSSGIRGTSPVKTNRGNSASPKLRAWQTNIPGFSSEAPPNLRTSLADRPASYVRGSSPASRNGKDSTARYSRQSISPTASRSSSSFYSHDRDQFSSRSKGSVASSGDEDTDSIQSIPVGSLDRMGSRRSGSFSNNRTLAYSKKSVKMVSPNSAPKRSFDSALRQMDRKSPQNMFRPLLSSVPSTTFYVGKANSARHSLVSRNSSVTTSSNASSDLCTSFAPDTEGSDHNHDDVASVAEKTPYPDILEEVFAFDKGDILNANIGHDINDEVVDIHHDESRGSMIDFDPTISEDSVYQEGIDTATVESSETSNVKVDIMDTGNFDNRAICSRCGCRYEASDQAEKDARLCPECSGKITQLRVIINEAVLAVAEDSSMFSTNESAEINPVTETDQLVVTHELHQDTGVGDLNFSLGEQDAEGSHTSCSKLIQDQSRQIPLPSSSAEGGSQIPTNLLDMEKSGVDYRKPNANVGDQQLHQYNDCPNLKIDLSEGTGISVLLKRSSSIKGPVVQGRTFTATTISYDDISLARGSVSSIRSSTRHGSYSASSSIDFSPAKKMDFSVQRQLSGRKLDLDCGYEIRINHQRTGSSFSGTSNHSHHGIGLATQETECGIAEEIPIISQVQISEITVTDVIDASSMGSIVEENKFEYYDSGRANDAYNSELLSQSIGVESDGNSVAVPSFPNYGDCISCENVGDHSNIVRSLSNTETSVMALGSLDEENKVQSPKVDGLDALPATNISTITESEIEKENSCQNTTGVGEDDPSQVSKSTMDDSQESSVPNSNNASFPESNTFEYSHGIEESTVTVECQDGGNTRSLTLEEATDTILFCSSIIHDLAYQAATIAMEKEKEIPDPLEGSKPTVTLLGTPNVGSRKGLRSRTVSKPSLKSQKARQRKVETDVKSPLRNTKNDENIDESFKHNVGLPDKVDSTKPPKLESKCNCTIM